MRPILAVQNLTKTYGHRPTEFTALKNLNLEIYPGESVAIVGKSGSGKSTLMHILALLDRPTSGTVELDGTPTSTLSARRLNHLRNQRFGFVFQQFFMNPQDTILENVILPLRIAKVRRPRAEQALRTVGLADHLNFKANDLSGGQKQRVCIARAIINHPEIIFADEPTGNLDSVTGAKIIDLLFKLNRQGVTLIIVTHDEDLAALCDRQIRLQDGKIINASPRPRRNSKTSKTSKTSKKSKTAKSQETK